MLIFFDYKMCLKKGTQRIQWLWYKKIFNFKSLFLYWCICVHAFFIIHSFSSNLWWKKNHFTQWLWKCQVWNIFFSSRQEKWMNIVWINKISTIKSPGQEARAAVNGSCDCMLFCIQRQQQCGRSSRNIDTKCTNTCVIVAAASFFVCHPNVTLFWMKF